MNLMTLEAKNILNNFTQNTPLTSSLANPFLGFSTGLSALDQQLPWRGLPAAGLSALVGERGSGRIFFWSQALALLQKNNSKARGVWIEDPNEAHIYPPALAQMGVDLKRLLIIRCPEDKKTWTLSQITRSRLFEFVACTFLKQPRDFEIQKIANEARACRSSLALFFNPKFQMPHWLFKLRLNFEHPDFLTVEKAQVLLPNPIRIRRQYEHTYSLSQNQRASLFNQNCG